MKEFVALRPEMYSEITDERCIDMETKSTKKYVIK